MRIFLVGFMGAGKSSVGIILADLMGYSFVDMDDDIEKETGKSISELFGTIGEQAFRELESKLLAKISKKEKAVIACGGGVVLHEGNREILAKEGNLVLYLKADADSILQRLEMDEMRPLLQMENKRSEIEKLLQDRIPLYKDVASMEISTDGKSPENIAEDIFELLKYDKLMQEKIGG